MLKQSVSYTYHGILYSNKKEWTINTSLGINYNNQFWLLNQNGYPENYGKWEKKVNPRTLHPV